jgi:dynein light intermediate chain 1
MEAGVSGGAGAVGANLGSSVTGTTAADRRLSRGTRPVASTLTTGVGPAAASGTHLGRPPISPTANSPSPAGGQTQHEVLQNFFQSLLSSKDRAGASAAAQTRTSPPRTNGTGTSEEGTS